MSISLASLVAVGMLSGLQAVPRRAVPDDPLALRCAIGQLAARSLVDTLDWMDLSRYVENGEVAVMIFGSSGSHVGYFQQGEECPPALHRELQVNNRIPELRISLASQDPPARERGYMLLFFSRKGGTYHFEWTLNTGYGGCPSEGLCTGTAMGRFPAPRIIIEIKRQRRELAVTKHSIEMWRRSASVPPAKP